MIKIKVEYDPKSLNLLMNFPFVLVDVARSFPSKRFDPKSKNWKIKLVRANVEHLREIQHKYQFDLSDEAVMAVEKFEQLTALPPYIPFPNHVYDFTVSKSGFSPRKHQQLMLDKAWNMPAYAWFARMGTGKTFSTIHLAMARWAAGLIDGLMIISPSTLRTVWRKELEKYATRPYDFRIHDTKAPWLREFFQKRGGKELPILAVSVEGLGVSEALYESALGFMVDRRVMVVVDESSRIKNPAAKRTQRAISIGSYGAYRLILNGSPIAVGIQDLFSQFEFLDSNIIGAGDYYAFKSQYLVMGGYEAKQIVGVQNADKLMALIGPYTLEVGKEVLDLPPKIPKTIPVELTKEQRDLLKIITKSGGVDANGRVLIKVDNTLERVLRCRQVVGGYLPRAIPRQVTIETEYGPITEVQYSTMIEPLSKNPKFDVLLSLIEDSSPTSKFVIWSPFTHEIEMIAQILQANHGEDAVAVYYGETDKELRSVIEDRYCKDDRLRFFIGNPAAAGLGLTLINEGGEDIHVYYSGTNNYIDRVQSEDRSHRIGQVRNVVIVDLVGEKSVDEAIVEATRLKMSIEEYVVMSLRNGVNITDLLGG